MENLKNYIRSLIQLSLADNELESLEVKWIKSLGKAHKISEEEIDQLIKGELKKKDLEVFSFSALSEDERFEYLYNIIQLMKIDNKVYLSEIKYCEKVAVKLGYKPGVIGELSGRVYSDSSISVNREHLKSIVKKYEI